MSSKSTIKEAHVLMFPFNVQGHLPPMLDLAQLLSTFGLYVTVLDSNFYNIPLHAPQSLQQLPNLRFLKLHDSGHQETAHINSLIDAEESRKGRCKDEYRRLLGSVQGWPPVTCVVADGFVPPALDVPEEMGIPIFILRTSSACSVWAYYNIPRLIDSKECPILQDEDGMDKEIHSIPGMEGILRRRDLPSFIRNSKSTDDIVLQYLITISKNLHRATGLLFNTVEAVEGHVLSHIRSIFPVTYSIGPLQKLKNTLNDNSNKVERKDETCLAWLDMQSSKSVVYASFGTSTKMSMDELLEFWHGLTNSGYPFLWVIRKDLVTGDAVESEKIIQGLKDEIKELSGCIVEWAPQQEVLAHEAVGCFLTHSGWNSTLESILAGVPMVSWPFWGDQMPNSRFVSEVWKIGVDMKDMMGRNIVEKMIREVMEGEKAKEMRESVEVLKKLTAESLEEEGSSNLNLKALVKHIKLLSAGQTI